MGNSRQEETSEKETGILWNNGLEMGGKERRDKKGEESKEEEEQGEEIREDKTTGEDRGEEKEVPVAKRGSCSSRTGGRRKVTNSSV